MKKITMPLIIILTLSYILIGPYMSKDVRAFKNTVNDLAYVYPFDNETKNIDVKITNSTLEVNLTFVNSFENYDILSKYLKLEYFLYELDSFLGNRKINDSFTITNIVINGKTNSETYKLNRSSLAQQSFFNSDGVFIINDKQLSSVLLKKELKQFQTKMKLSSYEKKILDYSYNMFNMLTLNGTYYYPKKDHQLVSEITCEKFKITSKELKHIYFKDLYDRIVD